MANPVAASDFLNEVDRCYGNLKSNQMIYSKRGDSRLEKEECRKAVIKNYILVYKLDEIGKTIIVLRFFYGARDYAKLL